MVSGNRYSTAQRRVRMTCSRKWQEMMTTKKKKKERNDGYCKRTQIIAIDRT